MALSAAFVQTSQDQFLLFARVVFKALTYVWRGGGPHQTILETASEGRLYPLICSLSAEQTLTAQQRGYIADFPTTLPVAECRKSAFPGCRPHCYYYWLKIHAKAATDRAFRNSGPRQKRGPYQILLSASSALTRTIFALSHS